MEQNTHDGARVEDGGPAFPRSPHSGDRSDDGMSLRDYFAANFRPIDFTKEDAEALNGSAMPEARSDIQTWVMAAFAKASYLYADAMLAARKAVTP